MTIPGKISNDLIQGYIPVLTVGALRAEEYRIIFHAQSNMSVAPSLSILTSINRDVPNANVADPLL